MIDWLDIPRWVDRADEPPDIPGLQVFRADRGVTLDASGNVGSWHSGRVVEAHFPDGAVVPVVVSRERCWPGRGIMGGMEHLGLYEHALTLLPRRWFCLLDAPCGSGYGATFLAQSLRGKVIGLDRDPNAVRFAAQSKPIRARDNPDETLAATFVCGYLDRDLDADPEHTAAIESSMLGGTEWQVKIADVTDGRYQAIVCIEGIEHVSDAAGVLRRFRASLTPPSSEYPDAGVLYLTTPDAAQRVRRDGTREPLSEWHVREYTEDEMREMLTAAGFVDVQRHRVHAYLESLVMTARVPS